MNSYDLVSSLQALPETAPIEIDGIQFGNTCQQKCVALSVNVIQTVCAIAATCK
ncbi:MAG: VenA family class IV lanthipeptide [Pseudonocardiaceae bacterium]